MKTNRMKRRKMVRNLGVGRVGGVNIVKRETAVIVKEGMMNFLQYVIVLLRR